MNFADVAKKAGWTLEDQVEVLLIYIDRQQSDEAFNDYLASQSGKNSEQVDGWIECIQADIDRVLREYGEITIEYLSESVHGDDPDYEKYNAFAGAIVEPIDIDDAYIAFMDNDEENWAAFITNNFGPFWGKLAELVNEHGY